MEFKDFDFKEERMYKTGELDHDFFYEKDSINDKFRDFLKTKYDDKVECYIKPFGCFRKDGDDITSFMVQLLDHNHTYRKCTNQIHVNFDRVKGMKDTFRLGVLLGDSKELKYKVSGYKRELSEQLFYDTLEFLDSVFEIAK